MHTGRYKDFTMILVNVITRNPTVLTEYIPLFREYIGKDLLMLDSIEYVP